MTYEGWGVATHGFYLILPSLCGTLFHGNLMFHPEEAPSSTPVKSRLVVVGHIQLGLFWML